MTGFSFDARASLMRARSLTLYSYNSYTSDTEASATLNVGIAGNVGRVADLLSETLADALDEFEERAALLEYDQDEIRGGAGF